ncbi:MAG TPA: DUF3047 domain-containing protein [Nitrospira sp.]|nr:DUF3047 domain-containing protein [Nitrospira sp.]
MRSLVWAVLIFTATTARAEGPLLEVGKFSSDRPGSALPDGWKPLAFKKVPKPTEYQLVKEGDIVVVKAVSDASASGLTKEVSIDPHEFPIVRWRWKVENLIKTSDIHRKAGDDYPARLYITFEYEPDKVGLGKKLKYKAGQVIFGEIPIAALNYIWDTQAPVGTIVENAFTDFAQMVVVESGSKNVGQWVQEERNVFEDYTRAFGEEPPRINGIAIMTDTDNTKERAVAYYGDIQFVRQAK